MARRYTQEQHTYLREIIPAHSSREVAELFTAAFGLPMTAAQAKSYATNNKIHKAKYYLPQDQIQFIKDNGRGRDSAALTDLVNARFGTSYTVQKINNLRYKYGAVSGLKTRVPNSGQFKPGHTSFTKGLKQTDFMSAEAIERTKATRFKPGHTPTNHRPVGSERINIYGYIEVKVAEPNKWRLKHQLVWERHHGPRAPGDMVIFLDGDKTNCNIDNLAIVSKSVNARLNQGHLRSTTPEVTQAGIALGKLIARTHEVQRRADEKKGKKRRKRADGKKDL